MFQVYDLTFKTYIRTSFFSPTIDTMKVYLQSSTPIIWLTFFHMKLSTKNNLGHQPWLALGGFILVPRFLYLTQQVLPRLEPYRLLADDWAADLTDLRCGQGFGTPNFSAMGWETSLSEAVSIQLKIGENSSILGTWNEMFGDDWVKGEEALLANKDEGPWKTLRWWLMLEEIS